MDAGSKWPNAMKVPPGAPLKMFLCCGSEFYVWSARGVLDNNILEVVKSAETFLCLP